MFTWIRSSNFCLFCGVFHGICKSKLWVQLLSAWYNQLCIIQNLWNCIILCILYSDRVLIESSFIKLYLFNYYLQVVNQSWCSCRVTDVVSWLFTAINTCRWQLDITRYLFEYYLVLYFITFKLLLHGVSTICRMKLFFFYKVWKQLFFSDVVEALVTDTPLSFLYHIDYE